MNSTNASTSCPLPIMDTTAVKAIKITSFCVIMLLALVMNSLVITVFAKNHSLHKTVNFFLVNMAVSDLLVPLVVLPSKLVILISGSYAWQVKGAVGMVLCKLVPLLSDISPAVSILCIVCITVDRFYAIIRPFRITMIPDKARVAIIGLVWTLSILYYSHYFHSMKLLTHGGETYCINDWGQDHVKSNTILVIITSIIYGALPLSLVVALYVLMLVGLKRTKVGNTLANSQTLNRHRRITSVTRQAFAIVVVFALCHFPQVVLFLMIAFVYKFGCIPVPYWSKLFFTAEVFLFANAVLNPCICLFFNMNYRTALWKLLRHRRNDIVHPEIGLSGLREEMREPEPSTRST